ncbi:MAG TPA: hypothetical protein VN516_03520 [Candidatus Baltobacteraceae bacterium]|nr:hypothetical protein [Candidatus Baltobacteraceae bacterium]
MKNKYTAAIAVGCAFLIAAAWAQFGFSIASYWIGGGIIFSTLVSALEKSNE